MRRLPAAVVLLGAVCGCATDGNRYAPSAAIILATTTSTRDTGLLDVLTSRFREQTGNEVKVVAVGSGQALEMGRRGDADILMTHSPAAEEDFLAAGFGIERRLLMFNDFILVGPGSDPAGVRGARSIAAAFARIAASEQPFVSRGDESGTHVKERAVWEVAGVEPAGAWYLQSGSGMGQTLRLADEQQAYTLTDRGTYLAISGGLELSVLSEGDPTLRNQYAVILLNPPRYPHLNHAAARRFADFLTSPKTQQAIGNFGVERFGRPLFTPNAAEES